MRYVEPPTRRELLMPETARRVIQRATAEHQRLAQTVRETVRETVAPMTKHGPVELVRRVAAKAWQDRILGMASEAAFWQLMSLPPLFLAVLGSLGYIADFFGPNTVQNVQDRLLDVFGEAFTPSVVDQIVRPTVEEVLGNGRADVISVGFFIALWAGSSATSTFVNTITIAYDMRDVRGAIRSRLISLWLYVASVATGVVLLPLLVLGPGQLAHLFPNQLRGDVETLVRLAYWPALAVLLLLALTSFYHYALPRRLPWRRGIPGALVAMGIFLVGGDGLRRYISFVVSKAYTYGTLAAPIATLLFLFLLALAILIGAELNATIEQMWPSKLTKRLARRQARHEAKAVRKQAALELHKAAKD